jgi:hypothetical protein
MAEKMEALMRFCRTVPRPNMTEVAAYAVEIDKVPDWTEEQRISDAFRRRDEYYATTTLRNLVPPPPMTPEHEIMYNNREKVLFRARVCRIFLALTEADRVGNGSVGLEVIQDGMLNVEKESMAAWLQYKKYDMGQAMTTAFAREALLGSNNGYYHMNHFMAMYNWQTQEAGADEEDVLKRRLDIYIENLFDRH